MTKEYYQKLEYKPGDKYYPIPPAEAGLTTVTAAYWKQVTTAPDILEGVHFNRTGDILYYVDCTTNCLMQVDMKTEEVSVVFDVQAKNPNIGVSASKVHKDGRIFVACCNKDYKTGGEVFAVNPDGTGYETIVTGYVADDITFDSKGGFYITHFTGLPGSTANGGVYYCTPDYKEVHPVLEGLAGPNGAVLSKDEKILWITETNAARVLRIELADDGYTIPIFGVTIVYHTYGFMGPDSLCLDDDDNVYVACFGQARVVVLNKEGWPIGQVLMPDRENGLNRRSSHPTIRPGTKDLYVCTSGELGEGAWIMRAGSYATANSKAYFLQ